jgi:hypothetical protein
MKLFLVDFWVSCVISDGGLIAVVANTREEATEILIKENYYCEPCENKPHVIKHFVEKAMCFEIDGDYKPGVVKEFILPSR